MLRRCETCPSDIDEELLAELKEWRLRTSKEMSVPAYVVFTDNTLIAIAETLPDRRRRARRDPRHRRAQARAVRPRRAGAGPQARPKLPSRKDRAKTAGQKIACRFCVLAFSLRSARSGASHRRKEGSDIMNAINTFTGVGVAGMSRTLRVAGTPRRIPHGARPLRRMHAIRRSASAAPPPRLVASVNRGPPRKPSTSRKATDPTVNRIRGHLFFGTSRRPGRRSIEDRWPTRQTTRKQERRTCLVRDMPRRTTAGGAVSRR